MKYTLDNICSRCVVSLINDATISARVPLRNGITADQQKLWSEQLNGVRDVASITRAMISAWNYETSVEIGPWVAYPALVTYNGDKVCDMHLVELWNGRGR
jgi:hypothetical protein